jgi:hypothetical protein
VTPSMNSFAIGALRSGGWGSVGTICTIGTDITFAVTKVDCV